MLPSANAPQRRNPVLWLVFSIILLDVIGITILIPVLPFIVAQYSSSALMLTALSVAYALMQFVAAPALGQISDRIGRRPVLIASVFGSAIGYFIFGIGGALWVLLLSRVIDGITGGNISTAGACIADLSQPHERARNFALIGMAWGFGFIIGPLLGTLASQVSLVGPAYLAGALSLLSVVVMWFKLPETHPPERRSKAPLTLQSFNPFGSIGQIASKPGMPMLMLAMLLFSLAFSALFSIQSLFVVRKFGIDERTIGIWLLLGGIGTALSQFVFAEKLIKRFGEKFMGLASLGVQGAGSVLVAAAPLFVILQISAPLLGMMRPFIWGALGAMMAAKVQPREQGVLSGVNSALQSATSVFGPLLAGALYDSVAPPSPLYVSALIFFAAFGVLLLAKPAAAAKPA